MSDTDGKEISKVARTVLWIGGGGILLLMIAAGIGEIIVTVMMYNHPITETNRETYNFVEKMLSNIVNLTLPFLGVWVGSVVAYYFGKANYDTAARTVQNAYEYANPREEILSTKSVSREMRKNDEKLFIVGSDWTVKETFERKAEWEGKYHEDVYRLPVVGTGPKVPVGYLEISDIRLYVNGKIASGKTEAEKNEETVKTTVKIGEIVENSSVARSSFALISSKATMKDASCLLSSPGICILYVTENGRKGEELLGILIAKDVAKCLTA